MPKGDFRYNLMFAGIDGYLVNKAFSIAFEAICLYFSDTKLINMKKNIALLCGMMFIYQNSLAQHADYKVVFDMSSRDTISQQAVVREINLIKSANPDAKLEVVVYGQGLNLILKDKPQAEAVEKLLGNKDVSFKVCAVTLQRTNTDKSQLVTGVEIIPDGIYEIITKQKEGWGYIKVAH